MRRRLRTRVAFVGVALLGHLLTNTITATARADSDVSPDLNGFSVLQKVNRDGEHTPGTEGRVSHKKGGTASAVAVPWTLSCETGHLLDCLEAPMCKLPDGKVVIFWDGTVHPGLGQVQLCPKSATKGVDIGALVLRAFRRVPLPAPQLSIQPPNGKTLVGLETIYSTTAEPFTRTLTLLGRQVTLRIEPSNFLWRHGDGTSETTDWAGKTWDHVSPDIDGYLTHVYEHTGEVSPSVEVTWSAEFRVGGGAWQRVNGTVTRAGAPVPLQVLEGQPVLNSY